MRRKDCIILLSPGRLYNIGNGIAFATGLLVTAASRPSSDVAGVWSAGAEYLIGSRSAVFMTLATLVFFASGEFYARAFKQRSILARNSTRFADLLSSLGAVLLAAALACVGNPYLATLSGALNAGGKLGSACLSGPAIEARPWGRRLARSFRLMALLSRVPAVVASFGGLVAAGAGRDVPSVVLSVVMLGCYALWAAADALLIGQTASPSIRCSAANKSPWNLEG